jgi:uncharacterized protein
MIPIIRGTSAGKMKDLDKYRPLPDWFAHNPYGIHGIGHAARVFVWANLIGTQLLVSGNSLSIEAIRWAAVLHDVGRLSDGIDKGHGTGSADWIAGHRYILPVVLPDGVVDQVLYCCRWHDTADQSIPVMTPELMCLKDADALDRVRIHDLNPGLLRSEPAKLLVVDAWVVYWATEQSADSWRAALEFTARRGCLTLRGLWKS